MPAAGNRGVQPESDYGWITLDDFTAGIYEHTTIAAADTQGFADFIPGIAAGKAPASVDATFNCMCMPGGGLGPVPGLAQVYDFSPGGVVGNNWLTGFLAHNELAGSGGEVLEFFCVQETDDGTNRFMNAYSYDATNNVFHLLVSTTNPSAVGLFGAPYPAFTRMLHTAPTTNPGNPCIVFPAGGPAITATDGQVYVYPSPTAPTVYGTEPLISGSSSVGGQIICHENRVIVLSGITYPYPAGGGFDTNEQLSFTDPPNSDILGFQQTVLAAEDPYGYGCGGSISAGELFLVKKRGGGLQVVGDLINPSVTFLPGVTPTGDIFGRGASTLEGFAYCSFNQGAWIWNGANTSQKISGQLDDQFFLPPSFAAIASNNYGFFVEGIGDKIYFSNNWVYDTRTNSWWRYFPTATQAGVFGVLGDDLFWVNQVTGPDMFAAPLPLAPFGTFVYRLNFQQPCGTWQWKSLPIKVLDNRLLQTREVVVRAQQTAGGSGSPTIQVQLFNGNSLIGQVTTPPGAILPEPTMIRMPIGPASGAGTAAPQTEDFTIQIRAEGGNGATVGASGAPILHSLALGYEQRQHAPTTGVAS